ncbi:PP2C family serine/threonine-protein phosphatase [Metabacillus fastidiosus]|uniref:PP2C family serine/threonine-protein phosphatase n=1 Tax=Metabacillus fastidiosus TaxID=1458 RepID=A0ABU6NTV7_9BACI|nr:PP2C family serine/threonine-protein phosphatase [Metabacillus fastidiosus]MED4400580.1 PP2C family serine/threonine-protein phosphatase [Metabacillus fastidiosus]MED4455805.1 PP2C family serine/threonine-protein phosphatase [Metabacillus fastidiosus]MED4464525.1 PP2C family serine/threonine-protein phosphatase [Metabacillus fastidiosus]
MIKSEENRHVQALAYQIQKEGNWCNGDSFFIKATKDYFICVVADGLGSGEHANHSSSAICDVVEEYHDREVDELIDCCNNVLKDKRGATVAILKVDFSLRKFTYSAVGNIRFVLYSPSGLYIYPLPILGYLSGKPQKYRTETFSYEENSTFIIHTDGLNLPEVKGLLRGYQNLEDMKNYLEMYTKIRSDDLTYVVGKLL